MRVAQAVTKATSGTAIRRGSGSSRSSSSIILVALSLIINTSYQKLPFGSGDYPDKLLFHQALKQVSNSSDRELPRDMFRFKSLELPPRVEMSCRAFFLGSLRSHTHSPPSPLDRSWATSTLSTMRSLKERVSPARSLLKWPLANTSPSPSGPNSTKVILDCF